MKTATTPAKHFSPAKSISTPVSLAALNLAAMIFIYFGAKKSQPDAMDILFISGWLLAIGYHIWKWNNTGYDLQEGRLYYRSGFTKGNVEVSSIRKIETNSRAWGNILAALTFKGLMITYNKWDEIFIAPKDQEAFLNELRQLNPEIQIIENPNS